MTQTELGSTGAGEVHHAPLLTTADLARRWQTTEQAVYSARHRGDCPKAVRIGKRLLWRIMDVEAWEESHLDDAHGGRATLGHPHLNRARRSTAAPDR